VYAGLERTFFRPETLSDALDLLKQYGSRAMIVNGGTDAVLHMVEKKAAPEVIIHVASLPGFHDIALEDGMIRLGGGVTYQEMLSSPVLAECTGLMAAIRALASPPIRVLATPVGNICTGAPAADCTTMLMALDCTVYLASAAGTRAVPLAEFYTGTYKTVRQGEELVTHIEFPAPADGWGTGYCRLSRRKAQDIGKVLIGARVYVEDGVIKQAAISLGALNPYTVRATTMEKALVGKTPEEALAYTAENFPKEAALRKSYYTEYKKDVVCPALTRALEMALQSLKGAAL